MYARRHCVAPAPCCDEELPTSLARHGRDWVGPAVAYRGPVVSKAERSLRESGNLHLIESIVIGAIDDNNLYWVAHPSGMSHVDMEKLSALHDAVVFDHYTLQVIAESLRELPRTIVFDLHRMGAELDHPSFYKLCRQLPYGGGENVTLCRERPLNK